MAEFQLSSELTYLLVIKGMVVQLCRNIDKKGEKYNFLCCQGIISASYFCRGDILGCVGCQGINCHLVMLPRDKLSSGNIIKGCIFS